MSDEDRIDSVLETLAAVRPMTAEAADVFRRTNNDGYFFFNAPLLVKNGSANALELFESMMRDHTVLESRRIDSIHGSLLPYRTSLAQLSSAERLLSSDLEESVAIGVIETIFDYQSKRWFGPAIGAPRPQPWESASDESLHMVQRLVDMAKLRALPEPLLAAVDQTLQAVEQILRARKE
jgi:hypothetical protein